MSDRPSPPPFKTAPTAGPTSLPTGAPRLSAPPPVYNANDDVHILDRLAVIYRYRHVAVAVFVLTTLAMMIQGYSTIQIFQSRAQILIEDERATAVPGLSTENYYEDPEPYYKTQYRILKGRDLARRFVKRLHIERVPEFNGTAVKPSGPAVFVHDVEDRLLRLFKPAQSTAVEPPKAD